MKSYLPDSKFSFLHFLLPAVFGIKLVKVKETSRYFPFASCQAMDEAGEDLVRCSVLVGCYGLNVFPQNSYLGAQILNLIILGDTVFRG